MTAFDFDTYQCRHCGYVVSKLQYEVAIDIDGCCRCGLPLKYFLFVKGKKFPILNDKIKEISWNKVEDYRVRIEDIHGQTLEKLAKRGGLSAWELWHHVHGKKFRLDTKHITEEKAKKWLAIWTQK